MIDVSLTISDGTSPRILDSVNNLLASGKDSVGAALQVKVRSVSLYFNPPQSTCDVIAGSTAPNHLSAKFWSLSRNTEDLLYRKIVSSPACLSFTFRKDQPNSVKLTIYVPLMLLNLNLEAPLVNITTSKFSCNSQSRGNYKLSQEILQAALVGVIGI